MKRQFTAVGALCLGLLAACGGDEKSAKAGVKVEVRDAPAQKAEGPAVPTPQPLSDAGPALLDERLPDGRVPPGGRDTGKAIALQAPQFTIEVVMAPDATQSSQWAALATSEYGDAGFAVQQHADHNNQYYIGIAGKPGGLVSSAVTATPGTVNYLAFTLADGKLRSYLNGEQKAVNAAPPGFAITNSVLSVQVGNSRTVVRPFNGRIYEVRISEKAMTAAEIAKAWTGIAKPPAEANKGK